MNKKLFVLSLALLAPYLETNAAAEAVQVAKKGSSLLKNLVVGTTATTLFAGASYAGCTTWRIEKNEQPLNLVTARAQISQDIALAQTKINAGTQAAQTLVTDLTNKFNKKD